MAYYALLWGLRLWRVTAFQILYACYISTYFRNLCHNLSQSFPSSSQLIWPDTHFTPNSLWKHIIKQPLKAPQKPRNPPAKALKKLPKPPFCRDKYRNNFRPWPLLDMLGVGFRHNLPVAEIFFLWSYGRPQERRQRPKPRSYEAAKPRPLFWCELFNDNSKKVWGPCPKVPRPKLRRPQAVPKRWHFCTSEQSEAAKKCRNSPYFKIRTWAHIYEVYILLFPRPISSCSLKFFVSMWNI